MTYTLLEQQRHTITSLDFAHCIFKSIPLKTGTSAIKAYVPGLLTSLANKEPAASALYEIYVEKNRASICQKQTSFREKVTPLIFGTHPNQTMTGEFTSERAPRKFRTRLT